MRSLVASLILAAGLACATSAAAGDLISFTDLNSSFEVDGNLTDTTVNWAVGWTQTVASDNVTVSALLAHTQGPDPGAWWITTAIGPSATPADVVASGTWVGPANFSAFDFTSLPQTVLATGLHFDPGAYFLVLDGAPPPENNPLAITGEWKGDNAANVAANLAPGFSLGTWSATGFGLTQPFAPSAEFLPAAGIDLAFTLTSVTPGVPEPATWALALLGFGLAGAALRRPRPATAR